MWGNFFPGLEFRVWGSGFRVRGFRFPGSFIKELKPSN